MHGSPSERTRSSWRPSRSSAALAVGLAVVGVVVPLAAFSVGSELGGALGLVVGGWAIACPLAVYRLAPRDPRTIALVGAGAAAALAIVSVATGYHNGLTDEPYAMPAFAHVLWRGHDPYVTPIAVPYVQYGVPGFVSGTYFYLPLLMFLQPFVVSYRWWTVACWLGVVALLRRRPLAAFALGQPFVGLLAASGFNDFPALLLLTVGFVGLEGAPARWAQWLAVGTKQFATGLVIAVYLLRRDVRGALVAVAVTLAFLTPFLVWNAASLACPMLLVWPPGCSGASAGAEVSHLNYWVWPVWVGAVFFEPIRDGALRLVGRGRDRSRPDGPGRAESISGARGPAGSEGDP